MNKKIIIYTIIFLSIIMSVKAEWLGVGTATMISEHWTDASGLLALDGNISTAPLTDGVGWNTDQDQWHIIDFKSTKNITSFEVYVGYARTYGYNISTSIDNVTFTLLNSCRTAFSASAFTSCITSSGTLARYVRINFTYSSVGAGAEDMKEYRFNGTNYTELSPMYNITNSANITNITTLTHSFEITSEIISSVNVSNTSSILYYKINTTLNNGCSIFEQSTCINTNAYSTQSMDKNDDTNFQTTLYDNQFLPAYYPFNWNYIDNTPHQNYTVSSGNNILFRVFNFSTVLNYTLNLEFNAMNKTGVTSSLLIYYCNSSYTDGNPALRPQYCELIDSFSATDYNHLHNNSKHHVIPVVISTITKTQFSQFVFVGLSNVDNGWNVEYVTNSSYNNQSFREGSFSLFNSSATFTNKIFDIHLHPFGNNDQFIYLTEYNDNGTYTNSSISTLLYNKAYLVPTGVVFINPNCETPTELTYGSTQDFLINWSSSISQLNYPLTYSLWVSDSSNIDELNIVSTNETYFNWTNDLWTAYVNSPFGNYYLYLIINDTISSTTSELDCYFSVCENDYQPVNQPCIDGLKLLYYYDVNSCNEQILTNFPTDNNTYINCTNTPTTINIDSDSIIFSFTEMDFIFWIILVILLFAPLYMNDKRYLSTWLIAGIIFVVYSIFVTEKLLTLFPENTFYVNFLRIVGLCVSGFLIVIGFMKSSEVFLNMVFGEKGVDGKRKK